MAVLVDHPAAVRLGDPRREGFDEPDAVAAAVDENAARPVVDRRRARRSPPVLVGERGQERLVGGSGHRA
ncbi:MAG: hypothetical protein AB1Z65_05035, partial [Candidatus Sulfomarinibacteraceae bacterium]